MKYVLIHLILIFTLTNCKSKNDSTINKEDHKTNVVLEEINSPYPFFFETLKIPRLTDTILVQNKTRIFGCGTGALEYREKLKESGLDAFYEKYGSVLSNRSLIEKFGKENNTKVLWITRGIEGEIMHLEDEKLHLDTALEVRLFREKNYVVFSEEPISLERVQVKIVVRHMMWKYITERTPTLTLKNNKWVLSNKDTVTNAIQNKLNK